MEAASYANLVGLGGSGKGEPFPSEEAQGRHVCSLEKSLTTGQGYVWRNEGGSWAERYPEWAWWGGPVSLLLRSLRQRFVDFEPT